MTVDRLDEAKALIAAGARLIYVEHARSGARFADGAPLLPAGHPIRWIFENDTMPLDGAR